QLGLRNIQMRHADGGFGWPEAGPYDGIISTAAPQAIPDELLKQLAPGGVLVIPVGGREQQLHLVIRDGESDKFVTRVLEPVKFVPFLSGTAR
ncbi:MAG TPA: protein-L-isoaspartate O-methyltransferase, partial [Cellvibrio sp.]